MVKYFQFKYRTKRRKIPQEFQSFGAISKAPPYYQFWSSSLLIANFWIFFIITHHRWVQQLFGTAANIWSTFPRYYIFTINIIMVLWAQWIHFTVTIVDCYFWVYFVTLSHDLTLIFNLFSAVYPKITKFCQLIYLSLYIQR